MTKPPQPAVYLPHGPEQGDEPEQPPKAPQGYGPFLPRAAWIVSGATVIIVLIFLSTGRFRLSQGGVQVLVCFIYSALISIPSILLLTRVGFRYTERFPRLVILMQAGILLGTATVGTFAGDLVLTLTGILPRDEFWRELRGSYPFALVISEVFGLSISIFETLRYRLQAATLELRTRQMEQERAYKLLAEARLSSLESRIHPHFLFNTLNAIAALIPSDPERAEETVGRLASLLRFSLNANHGGLAPLNQELKIATDYLEIEKTRFGARLRYRITVPKELEFLMAPPLAVQSLVENCVKHVAAERPQGVEIVVTGSLQSGRLTLEVSDDGPGFRLDSIPAGHGIANLMSRLELLFGDAAGLNVTQSNGRNTVSLSFPASPREPVPGETNR